MYIYPLRRVCALYHAQSTTWGPPGSASVHSACARLLTNFGGQLLNLVFGDYLSGLGAATLHTYKFGRREFKFGPLPLLGTAASLRENIQHTPSLSFSISLCASGAVHMSALAPSVVLDVSLRLVPLAVARRNLAQQDVGWQGGARRLPNVADHVWHC